MAPTLPLLSDVIFQCRRVFGRRKGTPVTKYVSSDDVDECQPRLQAADDDETRTAVSKLRKSAAVEATISPMVPDDLCVVSLNTSDVDSFTRCSQARISKLRVRTHEPESLAPLRADRRARTDGEVDSPLSPDSSWLVGFACADYEDAPHGAPIRVLTQ